MQSNEAVIPDSQPFRIRVADTNLQFRDATVSDPVPTGRQIILAAGGHPPEEFVALEWLKDGELREVELDDTTDLRTPGAERFIVAHLDRLLKFEIDGKRHNWPAKTITREALLAIAEQDPLKFSVWQELKKKADEEVLTGHPANLDPDGVERFYTVMKHTTEGSR